MPRFFLVPLLLTIFVESLVALCVGFRRPKQFFALFWVNIITNPALNYVLLLYSYRTRKPPHAIGVMVAEIGIVILEYYLLAFALPEEKKERLIAVSVFANLASYLAGVVLL